MTGFLPVTCGCDGEGAISSHLTTGAHRFNDWKTTIESTDSPGSPGPHDGGGRETVGRSHEGGGDLRVIIHIAALRSGTVFTKALAG